MLSTIGAVLLMLSLSLVPAVPAVAATINVPGDHATIQAAINAASENDTITVAAGVYDEFIIVNKSLTVQSTDGAAATIIHPTPQAVILNESPYQVVMIQADDVVFDGFTVEIDGLEWTGTPDTGIVADNASDVQILNNIVRIDDIEYALGIGVFDCTGVATIDNNAAELGVSAESIWAGVGIEADGSETVLVTNNSVNVTAEEMATGILTLECYIVKVLDNWVLTSVAPIMMLDDTQTMQPSPSSNTTLGISVNSYPMQTDITVSEETYKAQVNGNTVVASLDGSVGSATGIIVVRTERSEVNENIITSQVNVSSTGIAQGIQLALGELTNVLDNIVDVSLNQQSSNGDGVSGEKSNASGIEVRTVEYSEIGENAVNVISDILSTAMMPVEPPSIDAVGDIIDAVGIRVSSVPPDTSSQDTLSVEMQTNVHDNNPVNVSTTNELVSEAMVDAAQIAGGMAVLDYGILVVGLDVPQIVDNTVTTNANAIIDIADEPIVSLDTGALGGGIAIAQGITLMASLEGTISGNSVEADADLEAGVSSGFTSFAAESFLAELLPELQALYDIAQEDLEVEDESTALNSTPLPMDAYAIGGGLAFGIGINNVASLKTQIVNNGPVIGQGSISTTVFAGSEVLLADVEAYGGGLGIGYGIRSISSPLVNIADNGLVEVPGVRGVGNAYTLAAAAEEDMIEYASADAYSGAIGIGIRVRSSGLLSSEVDEEALPMAEVTGNKALGISNAEALAMACSDGSDEYAEGLGTSFSLSMGIAFGDVILPFSEEEDVDELNGLGAVITGNQADAIANSNALTGVIGVDIDDPFGSFDSTALAYGISAVGGYFTTIADNDPVTANATATLDVFVEEEPLSLDVSGGGRSLAYGSGIIAADSDFTDIAGNNAEAVSRADTYIDTFSEIPLNIAESIGRARATGAGLTLSEVWDCNANWNTFVGNASATVDATADATFDFSRERGHSVSAGALLLYTRYGYVNYNDLLAPLPVDVLISFFQTEVESPVVEKSFGLRNKGRSVNARYNWWGDPSGPSGKDGPGTAFRNNIGSNVGHGIGTAFRGKGDVRPWLSHPIADLLADNVGYFGFQTTLEQGWNTLSTPVALENPGFDAVEAIGDGLDWSIAYYYDPTQPMPWVQITTGASSNFDLYPLEGIYIKMNSDDVVFFLTSPSTHVPTRTLSQGQNWYLIGPTPYDEYYPFTNSMAVDEALVSLEITPTGNRGYNQVVSPAIGGQEPWVYVRTPAGIILNGDPTQYMDLGEGYWVFMENADTLAGFVFTPLAVEQPLEYGN
ncbi:hypothetical protein ACFLXT_01590 [Chloroflexota bacterium]